MMKRSCIILAIFVLAAAAFAQQSWSDVSVLVKPKPTARLSTSPDTAACQGAAADLYFEICITGYLESGNWMFTGGTGIPDTIPLNGDIAPSGWQLVFVGDSICHQKVYCYRKSISTQEADTIILDLTGATVKDNCISEPLTGKDTIMVHALPEAPNYSDTTICYNSSYTFPTEPAGVHWYASLEDRATNTNEIRELAVTLTDTTIYYYRLTNGVCCIDSNMTVNVFDSLAMPKFRDTTICEGEELDFPSYIPNDDYNYEWSSNIGSVCDTVSSISTATYTLTATHLTYGCEYTATWQVTVRPKPSNVFAPPNILTDFLDLKICAGDLLDTTRFNAFLLANGCEIVNITPVLQTLLENQEYEITFENSGGCSHTITVSVTVLSTPSFTFVASDDTVCQGADAFFEFKIIDGSTNNWTVNMTEDGITADKPFALNDIGDWIYMGDTKWKKIVTTIGTHIVSINSVDNGNLCIGNDTITDTIVVIPAVLSVEIIEDGNICEGGFIEVEITTAINTAAPTAEILGYNECTDAECKDGIEHTWVAATLTDVAVLTDPPQPENDIYTWRGKIYPLAPGTWHYHVNSVSQQGACGIQNTVQHEEGPECEEEEPPSP
jgi:hypothetical protein